MRLFTYHRRTLLFHRRTNLAVTLGVAVGTAALTGALLVGDSMRGSLYDAALGRLGRVDHALVSSRFFRESLASQIFTTSGAASQFVHVTPAILLSGGASNAQSRARANRISVIGVDRSFWKLKGERAGFDPPQLTGQTVILNMPLANELGAGPGDEILVRLGKPGDIASETLLGRRDDTTSTLRLAVKAIIPAEDLGAFSLNPRQFLPKNAYIPLATLQRAIDKRNRVNAMLAACEDDGAASPTEVCDSLQAWLNDHITLLDLGLFLRSDETRGYVALESEAMLIEPVIETAAITAADALGLEFSKILTYLANDITKEPSPSSSGRVSGIPYSTVTAIDRASPVLSSFTFVEGDGRTTLEPGEILLNEWAAGDLGARPGDRITLTYYVTGPFGRLETRANTFKLRGVVALDGIAADPGFTPEYKGVTDVANLTDWVPPFPMDLTAIRDKDEAYWDEHRTTPKAFISLADGERLWAAGSSRFGRLTSIRIDVANRDNLAETAKAFERELLTRIDVQRLDLAFEPVRAQMIAASEGTTDFGMLFVGFSFFLIISAAMLVALLFRLSVERRSAEVGLLLATGFSPRKVTYLLVAEGALLAVVGGAVGLAGAWGYAWLILGGLRSWWSDAVNAPFLRLHGSAVSFLIGFGASFLVALVSIAWSVRGLSRAAPGSLLAGVVAAGRQEIPYSPQPLRRWPPRSRATVTAGAALVLALVFVLLPAVSDAVPAALGFFISGAAMLLACLAAFGRWLELPTATDVASAPRGGRRRPQMGTDFKAVPQSVRAQARGSLTRLGIRNIRRCRGRSILTAGLIASASFLIVALQAFHLDVDVVAGDRYSGTGGFALVAESAVPLVYDLNTPEGREALNIIPPAGGAPDLMGRTSVMPFRLRPGDESSCLNLYRPTKPRILGATEAMIQRGGFVFASTLGDSPIDKTTGRRAEGGIARAKARGSVEDNPWLLLQHTFPDDAIPVIGDESTVKWQLHLGLGKDLTITDERGRDVRLRFVALLAGSVMQDELIMAESNFVELFPSINGHAFFLIDTPPDSVGDVEHFLERELAAFGFDAGSAAVRLADYLAVQNTYLSTFQMLGGFGLVLGTIGLAAVMLRNVWERRAELALMCALGFSRAALGWMVLAENAALLIAGLLAGSVSAMLAIAPHIAARPATIPWLSLGLTLAAVFATGLVAGVIAILPTLRAPLLPALRAE